MFTKEFLIKLDRLRSDLSAKLHQYGIDHSENDLEAWIIEIIEEGYLDKVRGIDKAINSTKRV